MLVKYKFVGTKNYHRFVELCHNLGIAVWVTTEDKNLNKQIKVYRRHVYISGYQKQKLSDFDYRIIE